MKFETYRQKWCPLGRISIQHPNGNGGITVVPAGAFNTCVLAQGGMEKPGERFMASTCIGPQCPLYRKSILPWRWGKCLFANEPLRGTLWSIFILFVGLLAGLGVFFLYFFQKGV